MNVDQYISSGVLELYALHALTPEEMRKVEDMVAQNPRVKDELDAIQQGLIKYAEAYAPDASEGLYDKILSRISELPKAEEPAQVIAPLIIPMNVEKTEIRAVEKEEKPISYIEPKVRSLNRGYWMAVAATVILLLISGSLNYYQYNQYNEVKGQLVAMQKEKDVVASNNNALKARFEETAAELNLYTDPHNKMVMMKGMPISPASEVMVMWNTKNNNVFVDVHRLPAPPDGMQYQLWAIDQFGKPVDAGLLTPLRDRGKTGMEQMNRKISNAIAFAITLEPKGGSVSPTIDKMYVKGGV